MAFFVPRSETALPTILCALMFLFVLFSGCLETTSNEIDTGEDEQENEREQIPLSIAFIVDQQFFGTENDPSYMAQKFSEETIFEITPYPVESEEAMIESLRFGHVDLAMMDAASSWMSWKNYGLEALLADQENYGRTYYNSNAWVKSDSDIATYQTDDDPLTDPFSLFEGKKTCHTGWFDSVGMLLPMGFLLGLGYANVAGNPNDVESLLFTIQDFFDDEPPIPEAGTKYYGYSGALRCLSDGTGDIAFLQDSSVEDHCPDDDLIRASWCLEEEEYTLLPTFGRSPSNALMYNPSFLDSEVSERISKELVELSGIDEMDQTLRSLFGTPGFVPTSSQQHLEGYSSLVYNIPGMQAYFENPSNTGQVNLSVSQISIGVVGPLSNSTSPSFGYLADSISNDIGINVNIFGFENHFSLVENLSNGVVNIAIADAIPSWKAWKQDGMSVLASLLDEQERVFSDTFPIVRSDSEFVNSTDPFSLMDGISPCFAGREYPSTILVAGGLVGRGLTNQLEDLQNSSISEIIHSLFNSSYSFPEENTEFHGTDGALRCLSHGEGDIAFVEGNEQEIFCQDGLQPSDENWCLDPAEYSLLPPIGSLPYKSVIYDPAVLDMVSRTAVLNSLLSLNYEMYLDNFTTMGREYTGCYDISIHKIDENSPREACGSEILSNSLHSSGFSRTTPQSLLGQISGLIGILPGQLVIDSLS